MQPSAREQIHSYMKLHVPAFWIYSEEPGRIHDIIVDFESDKDIYRLDSINGLVKYAYNTSNWRIVLVQSEEGLVPINDVSGAFEYVMYNGGIFILEFAHKMAEAIAGFILSLQLEYREAIRNDANNALPMQLALISTEDKLPEDISRLIPYVNHDLPSKDDLFYLFRDLIKKYNDSVPVDKKIQIYSHSFRNLANVSVGLSESEATRSAMESLSKNGYIAEDYMNDYKLSLLKDNGILEVRQPKMSLKDIGGMDNAKQLVDQISYVWKNKDDPRMQGINPVRRVLMVGVPGTGKSLFCEAVSSKLGLDLAKGGVSSAMDKFVGNSEKNIRRMFATLKLMAPITLWIDEFGRDLSGGGSSNLSDGGTTDRVHGEFLTGLQELPDDVLLVAAANRIHDLAPEMTRADRFDKIMFVGFPTQDERESIFKIHLNNDTSFDYELLASSTKFFTGAEIKSLVNEVKFNILTLHHRRIRTEDIIKHVPNVKGRVWVNHRDEVLAMYSRAKVEWDWASSLQFEEADEILGVKEGKIASYTPKAKPKIQKW